MNSRQLKRGKDVVSLTLTEIMLVLTVVVLVLLLASEIDLNAFQEEASGASATRDQYARVLERMKKRLKEMQEQIDMLEDKNEALKKKLNGLREDLKNERKQSDELRKQLAVLENERGNGRGNKYGLYIPCWPRKTEQEPRGRYHTYDVTYDRGLFKIKQSPDWNQPEVSSREKLDSELFAVLRDYPKTASKQDFTEFGKRVENVLAVMRRDNLDGWYKPKCSLVVTINPLAPVKEAIFIRQNVKMFPIGRDSR